MNHEHLKALCEDFSLGHPSELAEIDEGVLNQNFLLITSSGKYFIKSVREKRKQALPYIAEVETFMYGRGIPAVQMMKNTQGEVWSAFGSYVYTVYPFIESDRSHKYSAEDYRTMGEMLGNIHRAGSFEIPAYLQSSQLSEKSLDLVLAKLHGYQEMILHKPERDTVDEEFLSYIALKLSLIPTLEDIQIENDTLAHGDYHERNLLIDENRQIVGVCDWEKAQMAPRSHELVRAIHYVCLEREATAEQNSIRKSAFMEGYNSVYPISDEELELGEKQRFRKLVMSFWIEEQYYERNDSRSNKFIKNEMYLLSEQR